MKISARGGCAVSLVACLITPALATPGTGWSGNGGNANWTTSGNWDSGTPDTRGDLYFGLGYNTGSNNTSPNNNYSNFGAHRIVFEANRSTAFTLTGNLVTLYNYGDGNPVVPQIINDSGATQTINLPVAFVDNSGNNYGELAANSADLTFGSTVNLAGGNTQLRINSIGGKTITFDGAITSTGGANSLALNGNTTLVFNAANTYTGETFINAGGVRFETTTVSTGGSVLRLGNTGGNATARIELARAAGGQTLSSVINPRSGGSGTLTIASLNTSGTNAVAGHIGADRSYAVSQAAGGTLELSAVRVGTSDNTGYDLKGNQVTLTSAGTINVSGTFYNSTGSGSVRADGGGVVAFSNANTYAGGTTVAAGTVRADAAGASLGSGTTVINSGGTLAGIGATGGPVTLSSGGTITAGSGAAAGDSVESLASGNQSWAGGANVVVKFNSSAGSSGANWDRLDMGTLSISSGVNLVLKVTTAGSFLIGTPKAYDIVTTNSAVNGSATAGQDLSGLFVLNSDALGVDESHFKVLAGGGGSGLMLSYDGGGAEAAPEPTTVALAGLAGLAVMGRRRRRGVQ